MATSFRLALLLLSASRWRLEQRLVRIAVLRVLNPLSLIYIGYLNVVATVSLKIIADPVAVGDPHAIKAESAFLVTQHLCLSMTSHA